MYEIDQKKIPELSTKHLVAYIWKELYSTKLKEFTKGYKDKTWEYLPYGEVTALEKQWIQYQVLKEIEWRWLFDLNLENHQTILGLHIQKNHSELSELLQESYDNIWLQDYMNWLLVANRNLKDWDTNAFYLNSRFARALKGTKHFYKFWNKVEASADWINVMVEWGLKLIKEVQSSSQSWQEKTAKTAAIKNS